MSDTTNTSKPQGDPEALGDAGKKALDAERARANEAEKKLGASDARVAELEADLAKAIKATEDAVESALAEKQKLEESIKGLELEVSRLSIGIDEKLPMELIKRMQGDDEESLRADAKSLAAYVPGEKPSPFPKPDPSQGAKGAAPAGSTAEKFAAFMEPKLN